MSTSPSTLDSISPGLALVDPQLAAAARELLHEPGAFRPNWPVVEVPSSARRDPRPRFPSHLAGAFAIAVLALGAGHTPSVWHDADARPDARAEQRMGAANEVAARTYSWPSVPRARSYELRLREGTRQVYRVTTTTPSAVLPTSVRLAAGRYSWSVTPNLGEDDPRLSTAPVVEGVFDVRGTGA